MKLKFTVADPTEVIGPLREFYVKQDNGAYTLDIEGHPDAARIAEFRSNNIALKQQAEKFKGIDPDAARAALATVAAGETADVVKLKLELATAQAKADRAVLRDAIRTKALAAGVLPAALDIFLDKAEPKFTVDGDEVKAKPDGPASVDEWVLSATTEFPFLFGPSKGGGADGGQRPVLGAHSNVNVLRNPSPQELGTHAAAIASGKMKIEYTT